MYEIRTKWTNMVVYRTTERANAVFWLEENNHGYSLPARTQR